MNLIIGAIAVGFIVGGLLAVRKGAKLPSDPLETTDEAIERYVRMGRKLDAIKAYRRKTGVGLKESKEAIEAIAARLPKEDVPG